NREIINGKWLGSVLSVRRGWLLLLAVYFIGLWSGGLNFFAAMLTIAAWFVFALFFAALGLWFSATRRTTFQATALTIIATAFCLGLHWFVTAICCFIPLGLSGGKHDSEASELIVAMQLGLTPPFTLGAIPVLSVL